MKLFNAQDVEQGQLEDIGTFKKMWASCCAPTLYVLGWISTWFNDSSVGGRKVTVTTYWTYNPLCSENQLNVLFILGLFRQSTSTCFGHICSPSSVGIQYIYNNQYVLCFLDDCLLDSRPANRQSTVKHNTYQLLYIYRVPPDDGLQICPKHVEVDWQNKLRINSASSWFSLQGSIEMHGQQNIKFTIFCS
jgi:hypothetical protein